VQITVIRVGAHAAEALCEDVAGSPKKEQAHLRAGVQLQGPLPGVAVGAEVALEDEEAEEEVAGIDVAVATAATMTLTMAPPVRLCN